MVMGRKPRDMKNIKSGMLTAKERLDKKKNGVYLWLCVCKCGKTREVSVADLHQKRVKSCGQGCLPRGKKENFKRTEARAALAKELYKSGTPALAIAKKLRMSRQRVYQLLKYGESA